MIDRVTNTGTEELTVSCLGSESSDVGGSMTLKPYNTEGSGVLELEEYREGLPERLSRVSYGNDELMRMLRELAEGQQWTIEQLREKTNDLPSLSAMMVEQKHAG